MTHGIPTQAGIARMVAGLNHNLRHNGRLYHVQTEYRTVRGESSIQAVVFHEGAVLYQTNQLCTFDTEEQKRLITLLHRKAIVRILSGRLENGPLRTRLDDAQESSAEVPTLDRADLSKAAAPAGVDQARTILVELSGMDGFRGMGVFSRDGQVVSFLSASEVDISAMGKAYGDLLSSLRETTVASAQGTLEMVSIRAGQGTVFLASFEKLLDESSLGLLDILSHIIVVITPDVSADDIIQRIRGFMVLIVEELNAFTHSGARAV